MEPADHSWEDLVRSEEVRKAHLNGAAQSPGLPLNSEIRPPVWGGWGQSKPRVRLPRALGAMGFPFVPPKPPPPSDAELRALEFRRTVAGMERVTPPPPIVPDSPR